MGEMGGAGASCAAIRPPAKAACIGSLELTAACNSGLRISSSPKQSIAEPKAAAIGSATLAATFIGESCFSLAIRSGRDVAAIRKSFAKGPNSTVPAPESVLNSILNNQAPVSEGTQNLSSSFSPEPIRSGAPRGCACVPSMARISPLISHKSQLESLTTSMVTSRISSSSLSISSTTAQSVAVTPFDEMLRCAMNRRHIAAT